MELRDKVERLIGTAILKNDKNYTDDMMKLIELSNVEAQITILKQLKEDYHNNIVSEDRMDLEINERLTELQQRRKDLEGKS